MDLSLYDRTKSVHHDAEEHPFGKRMAHGDITLPEWADWLGAMQQVHLWLDPFLPPFLQRGGTLTFDLAQTLPTEPRDVSASHHFMASMPTGPVKVGGAAYVLTGAHLRGGAVIRKRLIPKGFPCNHLRFHEPKLANDWIVALREAPYLEPGAHAAFESIIAIMDEIEGKTAGV